MSVVDLTEALSLSTLIEPAARDEGLAPHSGARFLKGIVRLGLGPRVRAWLVQEEQRLANERARR